MSQRSLRRVLCAAALAAFTACDDGDDGDESPGGKADGGAAPAGSGSAGKAGAAGKNEGGTGANAGGDASAAKLVTIRFKAKVGGADFACGQSYPGQGSTATTVKAKDFRFYVMDLRLVNSDGEEVPVVLDERLPWQTPEVALMDFENGECETDFQDADLNDEITGKVPEGDYEGVAFVNGVPEELNHADPATLAAPLQKGNLTWGWLPGFRFLKAELVQDAMPPAVPGNGWAHSGSTACTGNPKMGTVSCAKKNRNKVKLENFDPDTNVIVADVGAIFKGTDMTQDKQCHGSGAACDSMFEQLGIDYETGNPMATQSVYRVE